MPIKVKEGDFKKKTITETTKGASGLVKELNNSMQYFKGLISGFKEVKSEIADLIGKKQMAQQVTPQQIQQPVVTPQLQKQAIDIAPPIGKSVPNNNHVKTDEWTKAKADLIFDEGLKMIATVKDMDMPQFIDSYKSYKDLVINKVIEILNLK